MAASRNSTTETEFLRSYCSRALVRTGGGHFSSNPEGEKGKNKIKAVLGGKKTTEEMGRKEENQLYVSTPKKRPET